jgi:hypothetical protein
LSGSRGGFYSAHHRLQANLRKSYGFRIDEALTVILYRKHGAFPEPELAHRFLRNPNFLVPVETCA